MVAPDVRALFKQRMKELFRRGRGMSVTGLIEAMTPKLRGWMA